MASLFDEAEHDEYEEDDEMDNSVNPDPDSLPKPRTEDDPELDAAP